MKEFPVEIHFPARTEKHCGMCPHHKLIGALHVRSGHGGYREYSCTHDKVDSDRLFEGRYIGKTEKTPDWCPLLKGVE